MKIEVLVATMHQKDYRLLEKMKINSNVLFINQSDINMYDEYNSNGYRVRMFSNTQRGLSKSRNQALLLAEGEVCLLADDDIEYKEGYREKVLKAFEKIPDADIIVFNTTMINYSGGVRRKEIKKIRRAPRYKNYGSVRIAFRKDSLLKNNIWFNIFFGAGSFFGSGEESLVLRAANKKRLKIYEYPESIAEVDYSVSTWFEGYNEKYFYNKGAFLEAAYPKCKYFLMYYFLIKFRKLTTLSDRKILYWIRKGFNGYKELKPYEDNRIIKWKK